MLAWFAANAVRPACLSPWLIRAVQRALEARGLGVGPVDGVLGLRTQAALREFQKGQGLAASGQPDAATVASLSREGETASR
jgi:peptidoglycan hydrolase-like protein with peptidoglycan-binding domain